MNKTFWRAAAIRAVRTVCQTACAVIGSAFVLSDVNWITVISASILAGILSVLTSIATGLPEVDELYMYYDEPNDSEVPDHDD